ncbi:conserved hypothetical protein [Talaromyces marneffei ATCC 18224]|uniref:Uncharacterized protein n=1 Tax=Talaromyces marneffei (strain ATCC 18224 / CBS 334.59 / QM 7333) TaxID=441960 RepID=B6QIG3_TALMQ|nr:conserved hypothetical protein [Talaromyces marneffei ATCC 18224]
MSAIVTGIDIRVRAPLLDHHVRYTLKIRSACCAVRQTATPFRQRSLSVHPIAEIPEPNDVFRWLRATLSSIPDARDYVDTAFDDLEKVRKNDQDFDKIVKEIFDLVGDGASDSLQTHPGVKEPVGSSYDQLKQMGDGYTWQQTSDIIKGGVSVDSAEKLRSPIQDKNKLHRLEDEACSFEKNPKLQQFYWRKYLFLEERKLQGLMGLSQEGSVRKDGRRGSQKYVKERLTKRRTATFPVWTNDSIRCLVDLT